MADADQEPTAQACRYMFDGVVNPEDDEPTDYEACCCF